MTDFEAYECIGLPVWVWSSTGELAFANTAAQSAYQGAGGYEPTRLDAQRGWYFRDEQGRDLPRSERPYLLPFKTGRPNRSLVNVGTPRGYSHWVLLDCRPVRDKDGSVALVVSTGTEVSNLLAEQEALTRSEQRYRNLIEMAHEGICIVDANREVTYVNRRLCQLLGFSAAELVGRKGLDFAGSAAVSRARFSQQFGRTSPAHQELPLRRKDGTTLWAIVSATHLEDEDGTPTGLMAIVTDVTGRKLAEDALSKSERRARGAVALLEQLTADAIIVMDNDGVVRSWNQGAERIFGYRKAQVIGTRVPPGPASQTTLSDIGDVLTAGETVTREVVRHDRDGKEVTVLGSWSPVELDDGTPGVMAIFKDLTDHKITQQRVREHADALALMRERERIAMDLHDGAIQSMYGAALALGTLRRGVRGSGPGANGSEPGVNTAATLTQAIDQINDAIQSIRAYIFDLRSTSDDRRDFTTGLKVLTDELEASAKVAITTDIDAEAAGNLGETAIANLLHIAHEALSNVARHARASRVSITLAQQGGGVHLTIEDDGRGFEPSGRGRRAGDGLHNIQERARSLRGDSIVDSAPGKGTRLTVTLP